MEENSSRQLTGRSSTRWSYLYSQIIKVNFDAAYSCSNLVAGIGGMTRDSNGHCVAEKLTEVGSATIAEALAAKRAMEMVLQHSWNNVHLEEDCFNLIDTIKDSSPSLHEYGPLVEDIKRIAATLTNCKVSHVLREGNRVADCLARQLANK